MSKYPRPIALCLFFLSAAAVLCAQNRIAIPSYQDPGSSQWNAWQAPGRSSIGIMIVNEDNGDDLTYYPDVDAAIQKARKKGISVIGYVHTGYGQRDLATVKKDIDGVYQNYLVDGIFFDETPTDCTAATSANESTYAYYQELAGYVRARQTGGKLVILNPGTQPANDCWMSLADILVTAESSSLKDYKKNYQDQAWFHRYAPDRFWHIVYNVSDSTDFSTVLALSQQRGAGWVYITDGTSANPYRKPPAYWQLETSTIAGEAVQAPYATFRPRSFDENGNLVRAQASFEWKSDVDSGWYLFIDTNVKSHPRYSTSASGLAIAPDYLLKVTKTGTATLSSYSGNGNSFAWTEVTAGAVALSLSDKLHLAEADAAALEGAGSLQYQIQPINGGQPSLPEPLSLNNTSDLYQLESH
jgi:hypothetical protein